MHIDYRFLQTVSRESEKDWSTRNVFIFMGYIISIHRRSEDVLTKIHAFIVVLFLYGRHAKRKIISISSSLFYMRHLFYTAAQNHRLFEMHWKQQRLERCRKPKNKVICSRL